ncbi:MAG: hypothetical protein L6R35_007455, partial [Caloplaca aegaea]
IAEDVLKERKIKLTSSKRRPCVVKSPDAFRQRQADSKAINVGVARIEGNREVLKRRLVPPKKPNIEPAKTQEEDTYDLSEGG